MKRRHYLTTQFGSKPIPPVQTRRDPPPYAPITRTVPDTDRIIGQGGEEPTNKPGEVGEDR